MLIHFGVTPYLVFDGDYLPSKSATEEERSAKRSESKRIGLELYHRGKLSQAHLELQKAIDVTPEMARQLIEELKRHKVQYVVAPYEADAQLAYLERKNFIQGVLSEDSDLLVFGVKRLLTKLDQYGDCVEINRADFTACRDISLIGWSDAEFRRMAILSGCDYLASINKMGLKTAYRLVRRHKSIEKILRMLQFDAQYRVPPDYLDNFRKAELTFLHQRVFCPTGQKLVMATESHGPESEEFDFIGKHFEAEVAIAVAKGDLNPMTKERMKYKPSTLPKSPSPWGFSRSKTLGTPSELKPKKPIDAFFKPRRTPLAELDPNSLTPSPRQQQLLEEYSGSVLSTPVMSANVVLPSADSTPASNRRRSPRSSTSANGRNHQSKRLRLCEDSDGSAKESQNMSAKTETSRFFTSTLVDPSPSQRRGIRSKKAADLNIWSDDSIDDIMVGLPDVGNTPKPQEAEVSIFCETGVDGMKNKSRETENRTMADEGSKLELQASPSISLSIKTSDPSTIKSFPTSITDLSDSQHSSQKSGHRLTKEFLEIAEKYTYNATPPQCTGTNTTPSSSGLALATICSTSKSPRHHQNASPSEVDIGVDERFLVTTETTLETTLKPTRTVEASPTSVPKSPELLNETSYCGSEDFIIPNSEDEADEAQVVGDGPDPKATRNLSRFVFGA